MVVVENLLRTLQIEVVVRIFAPRQVHHRLQIVHLHAVFRSLRVEHVEFVEFLEEHFLDILRPVLAKRFRLKLVAFGRTVTVAQLFLDVLDLLLQEVLTLLLVDVLARLGADVLSEL